MKKIIYLIIFSILLIPNIIFAQEKELNLYLFYGDGCPHCKQMHEYLDEYLDGKDNLKDYMHNFSSDTFDLTNNIEENIDYIKSNYHNKKYVFECLDDVLH